MNRQFLVISICMSIILCSSTAIDNKDPDMAFKKDFEEICRLGEEKDIAGLLKMVETLKARWKDVDVDAYCQLMNRVCGSFRTDFDQIDWDKLMSITLEILSDIEIKMNKDFDPILVIHYYAFQDWYISVKYYHYGENRKGDMSDNVWADKRKDVISRLLKVGELIQDVKDPSWNIDVVFAAIAQPPNGAPPGISPDSIKDLDLRAKYEADIKQNDEKKQWWDTQYRLSQTEDFLKKRLVNDIKVMYNTPPLAPDELKGLLDTYVKDEEQKKMFLEASQKQEQ